MVTKILLVLLIAGIGSSCVGDGKKLNSAPENCLPVVYDGKTDLSTVDVYLQQEKLGKIIKKVEGNYYIEIDAYMKKHRYSPLGIFFNHENKLLLEDKDDLGHSTENFNVDTIYVAELPGEKEYYTDDEHQTVPSGDSLFQYFLKQFEKKEK